MTVSNAPGVCGANVNFSVTAGTCTVTSSPASGSFFPVGTTTVTSTARAANGTTSTCSFTVTVNDTEAPKITNVSANPNTLWPPNHKMRDVMVNYNVSENCAGPVNCQLTVSSNEPVNGIGDGNTAPDWIVLDAHRVQLRSERAGPLNGRVYTITIGCTDPRNNASVAMTTVTVPHDQGNKKYSDLKINVSPNPSRASFGVNINSDDAATKISVTITDLQGRTLETRNNINAKQTITIGSTLRPGTYIIKAQQGESVSEIQVLKQ
ncbi:MAG TPA: T9SS type A sorting domain-containing protein [Flavisolibacter sp.]|nr:T9SS type A sorting domain-containing protein [Flavisolibacter sp.]